VLQKEEVIPMSYRDEFKGYVVRAVVRQVGVPAQLASDLVDGTTLGAMMKNNAPYILFKGADYWAEKILAGVI
jgi:hypothetical protein